MRRVTSACEGGRRQCSPLPAGFRLTVFSFILIFTFVRGFDLASTGRAGTSAAVVFGKTCMITTFTKYR